VNFLKIAKVMNTEFAFYGNDFNVENKIFDKLTETVCKKLYMNFRERLSRV